MDNEILIRVIAGGCFALGLLFLVQRRRKKTV